MRSKGLFVFLLVLYPFYANAAYAQVNKRAEVEGGVYYFDLDNGFSNWRAAYIRGMLKTGSKDVWYGEVSRQEQFDDKGTYFSVGNVHTFNSEWYSFLAVGSSTGGFFLPSVRVDGEISRKWLGKRNLVTSIGGGYFEPKDIHRNASIALGAIYYFEAPVIVQGGVRWNVSAPGAVVSRSQYVAVTEGREGSHFIVIRGQFGREAYQAITETVALVDFPSHGVSATWKQWIGHAWGFNTMAEYYESNVYRRTGGSVGLFKSFQ